MPVHTKLEIRNKEGETRSYQTKRFNGSTTMKDINAFIFKKCPNSNPPSNIEILDQYQEFVTLDRDHLEEYAPFDIEERDTSTVQSINSSEKKVTLRVTLPNYVFCSTNDQEYLAALEEVLDDAVPTPPSSKPLAIRLSEDPKMGFLPGHNVNYEQRDQYICDKVNVDTRKITGKLSMLQGEKDSTNKYQRIRPQLKVWNNDIKTRADHCWTILVYLVLDVYELGKRSLFYHPQRTFVSNDDENQPMNPCKIPMTDDNWSGKKIVELQLITVAIEGAKKRTSSPLNLLCNLKDNDENESFDLPHNYIKSRLALVLCKDDECQWETLVLSNEMIFIKKIATTKVINILDTSTITASTLSKRKRAKKCQTKSNQLSKRTKRVDHSFVMNPSLNSNASFLLVDQNLAMDYHNNRVMSNISRAMSIIPEIGSEFVIDSSQTGNLYEHPTDIFDILMYDSNSSAAMSMNNVSLINNDVSLNFTDGFSIDSPNL